MKKIPVAVPRNFRYVRTYDGHCYEITKAYAYPSLPPQTFLVSKYGKKIDWLDVTKYSGRLFDVIDSITYRSKMGGGGWMAAGAENAAAMFGESGCLIVAETDSKGDLHLLPEKEQKYVFEFEVTEKHRKAFREYKRKMERRLGIL